MKTALVSIKQNLKTFFLPCAENMFYPQSLRKQALVFYALVIFLIKAFSLGSGLVFPRTGFFADVSQQLVLFLTNQQRQNNGLAVLNENPILVSAAKQKAMDMITNDYFAHVSPQGVTPWFWFKNNGYNYRYAGENLAIDFLESSDVVNAWMNSPGHRQNILNDKYQEIGIAVVQGVVGGQNTTVVVQMFGSPKIAAVQPTPTPIPTVKPLPIIKPSPSPVVSIMPSPTQEIITPTIEPLATAEPVVAGEIALSPLPIPSGYTGPVITRPSAVAGAQTRSMVAWNFLVDTMSNPSWLYWLMLGYLGMVMVLGIFSRVYTPQPGAFIGIIILLALTATIMAMPDTDQILQWNVRVL
jgi:uncharacterized protein YkwD